MVQGAKRRPPPGATHARRVTRASAYAGLVSYPCPPAAVLRTASVLPAAHARGQEDGAVGDRRRLFRAGSASPPRDREFRPTRIRIQTTVFPRQRRWRATGLPQAQAVGLVVWDHRGRNPDDSRGGSPVTPQRQPAARRRSRYWRARIVAAIPKPARSVIQPGLISSSAATTSATLSHRRHARRR